MEQEHKDTHTTEEHTSHDAPKEDLRISGDDILNFLRKIFRAGNSRMAVFEDGEGKQIFKINLILLMLIFFFIPVVALIFIIILITADYSISVQKRHHK
ncbi:MAG: hypothetical protein ACK4FA_00970 [Candidatus Paceibacteria bacterium]